LLATSEPVSEPEPPKKNVGLKSFRDRMRSSGAASNDQISVKVIPHRIDKDSFELEVVEDGKRTYTGNFKDIENAQEAGAELLESPHGITPQKMVDLLPDDLRALHDEGRDLGFDAQRAKELGELPPGIANADLVGQTFLAPFFQSTNNTFLFYMGGELVEVPGHFTLARDSDPTKANVTDKPQRVDVEKQDVRHILQWTDETGKNRERSFAAYSMAKREADRLEKTGLKDVGINTITTPRAELEVKTTDAPQSVKYTVKGGFDVSEMDPEVARLVKEDVRVSSYGSDELNVALRDALQEKAEESKGGYAKSERDFQSHRKITDAKEEANTERRRLKGEAKKVYDKKVVEIARSHGVPKGRGNSNPLSGAKQWKDAIANSRAEARRDSDVVQAEKDAEEAEQAYQELASQETEAKREQVRRDHKQYVEQFGEIEPGEIRVSRKLGPATAFRMDSWNEKEAAYDVAQGAFVESTGKFYQQYDHLQEMTPYAVFEAYGTVDESRTVQAVKMQVDAALEKAKKVRSDKAAKAAAKERAEKYRQQFRTKNPVKATPARMIPLEKQQKWTKGGKPAIGTGSWVIWDAIPQELTKRRAEAVAHKKGGEHDKESNLDAHQDQWTDKTAKPLKSIGYMESEDSLTRALVTDGESVIAVDADFHDFFTSRGFTLSGGDNVMNEGKPLQIRKGKKIVGVIQPLGVTSDQRVVKLSEVQEWMPSETGDTLLQTAQEDPPHQAARLAKEAIKDKAKTFAEYIEHARKELGDEGVRENAAYLEDLWEALRTRKGFEHLGKAGKVSDILLEGAPRQEQSAEEAEAEAGSTTGTKYARTEGQRASVGDTPRESFGPRSFEERQQEAIAELAAHSERPYEIISDMEAKPRPLTDQEDALLNARIRELKNDGDIQGTDRQEWLDLNRTVQRGHSEWGYAGHAAQVELAPDFSVEGLTQQHVRDVGSDPTAEQLAKYAEKAAKVEKLEAENQKLKEKLAQEEVARKIAEAAAAKKPKPPKPKAGTKKSTLQKKASDALSEFNEAWSEAAKTLGTTFTTGGLNPEAIGALPKVAKAAAGVVKAYAEMGVNSFLEFMASVKSNMKGITSDQEKAFKDAWASYHRDRASEFPITDKSEIGARAKDLMSAAIDAGLGSTKETWREVVDAVHEQLSLEVPGISEFDTMQAMSDYGQYRTLDRNEKPSKIRAIRGKARQSLKIEDLLKAISLSEEWQKKGMSPEEVAQKLREQGLLPKATGREQATPDSIESDLIAQVDKLKKDLSHSAPVEGGKGQLQTALTSAKTSATNRLGVLEREAEALEEAVAAIPPKPLATPVREGATVKPDAKLTELRQKMIEAREKRDKWKKEYEKIFPPTKKQRMVSAAEQELRAQNRINDIQNELQDIKDGAVKDKTKQPSLLTAKSKAQLKMWQDRLKAAKAAAKELETARWDADGGALLPAGRKPLTDAQRLKMAERLLERRIEEVEAETKALEGGAWKPAEDKPVLTSERKKQLRKELSRLEELRDQARKASPKYQSHKDAQRLKADEDRLSRQIELVEAESKALEEGTWKPKTKRQPVTSETKKKLQAELADLGDIRERARKASPAYQAREEAKYWERYRKTQERRLAFWENRRDDAKQGKLPKKRKKKTPTNNAIIDKNLEIEHAQYDALFEVEKARRANWNAGQWIGHGLLEATSLIPKSLMLGLELSFFKRQGFFYARSHPIRSLANSVNAIQTVFSQRAALASMEDIEDRPNAREYHQGGVDFTRYHGPKAAMEEMFQSAFVQWLENTEGKLFLPLRTYAKIYSAFERGNRTFANTMKADLYDIQKRDTLAAREFFGDSTDWTENDIKQAGRTANIFSGRGTGLKGGNPWLDFVFLARRWAMSRIQTDFQVPFQLMTPKQIGQWNADRGMRVAMAKLYLQTLLGHATKLALGYWVYTLLAGDDEEKKPTIEFDLRSSDAWALKMGETRVKDEGGIMPPIVLAARVMTGTTKTRKGEIKSIYGEDVQYGGQTAADFIINYGRYKLGTGMSGILEWASGLNAVGQPVTKTEIVTTRITPLTYREIIDAEIELGVKQGTAVALEAFLGATVSTYGDRTSYRQGNKEERKDQFKKDLEGMDWDTPPMAYRQWLRPEQLKKVEQRKEERKQSVVFNAVKDAKTDESKEELEAAKQKFEDTGWSHYEAQQHLFNHYIGDMNWEKFKALGVLYELDDASAKKEIQGPRDKKGDLTKVTNELWKPGDPDSWKTRYDTDFGIWMSKQRARWQEEKKQERQESRETKVKEQEAEKARRKKQEELKSQRQKREATLSP